MTDELIGSLQAIQRQSATLREAVRTAAGSLPDTPKREETVKPDKSAVLAQVSQDPGAENLDHVTDTAGDAKRVFVIHGRNVRARNAVFQFLRTVGLYPLTWEEAVRLTDRGGSPTTLEVVRAGLAAGSEIVVLLTPDEHVELKS